MNISSTPSSKLLWLDLEMTGLDPQKDLILEVAAIMTDWELNELETYESGVGQNPQEAATLLDQNPFYAQFPDNKQQLLALTTKSPDPQAVEAQLLALANRHLTPGDALLLAGNSIYMDRSFIRRTWPQLDATLHYRMLDVSAWKVVMNNRYGVSFDKSETHRALQDIRESIAELQYYQKWFGQA